MTDQTPVPMADRPDYVLGLRHGREQAKAEIDNYRELQSIGMDADITRVVVARERAVLADRERNDLLFNELADLASAKKRDLKKIEAVIAAFDDPNQKIRAQTIAREQLEELIAELRPTADEASQGEIAQVLASGNGGHVYHQHHSAAILLQKEFIVTRRPAE